MSFGNNPLILRVHIVVWIHDSTYVQTSVLLSCLPYVIIDLCRLSFTNRKIILRGRNDLVCQRLSWFCVTQYCSNKIIILQELVIIISSNKWLSCGKINSLPQTSFCFLWIIIYNYLEWTRLLFCERRCFVFVV